MNVQFMSTQEKFGEVVDLAKESTSAQARKRGAEVVLLEGRSRPGGRVETLREGFAPGLTAETGATRIPDTHDLTLGYVREFGLPLEPFHPSGANDVFHLRGKNLTVKNGRELDWPLNLRPEERRLGRGGLTESYLLPPLTRSRGSELSPQAPEPIVAVDQASVHDYLAQQRLSEDALHGKHYCGSAYPQRPQSRPPIAPRTIQNNPVVRIETIAN